MCWCRFFQDANGYVPPLLGHKLQVKQLSLLEREREREGERERECYKIFITMQKYLSTV
jgi:hypothetical protein